MKLEALSRACQEKKSIYKLCRIGPCMYSYKTYIGKGRWLGEWCRIIVRHGLRLWHGHCKMRPRELVNDFSSPNLICRNANKTYIGKGRWLRRKCKFALHFLREANAATLWHAFMRAKCDLSNLLASLAYNHVSKANAGDPYCIICHDEASFETMKLHLGMAIARCGLGSW